ncbi:hypothetical protein MAPG_08700 [Magnaporthiopsis poae ATCC 64411]|uniref:Uncharacterized protein n=1 Tax=Magnaporthiopsis poae (strain ATCC 64411 / 73-15) TaxID=644358 RepID=A0A0C4E814_MAGP6|nr:hypothetical protein MAPG_08700 [Magnaporthiopsis poae ATCC 64411]
MVYREVRNGEAVHGIFRSRRHPPKPKCVMKQLPGVHHVLVYRRKAEELQEDNPSKAVGNAGLSPLRGLIGVDPKGEIVGHRSWHQVQVFQQRGTKSLSPGVYQKVGQRISEDVVRLANLEEDGGLELYLTKSGENGVPRVDTGWKGSAQWLDFRPYVSYGASPDRGTKLPLPPVLRMRTLASKASLAPSLRRVAEQWGNSQRRDSQQPTWPEAGKESAEVRYKQLMTRGLLYYEDETRTIFVLSDAEEQLLEHAKAAVFRAQAQAFREWWWKTIWALHVNTPLATESSLAPFVTITMSNVHISSGHRRRERKDDTSPLICLVRSSSFRPGNRAWLKWLGLYKCGASLLSRSKRRW